MDMLLLSRIQFGLTVAFHFIFVPLTIGLIILVAIMETFYYKTKKPIYKKMSNFWGKLFAINFVLGVVTGITMEFQIGMNWSEYSAYMGDIFGTPLAIEALVAFFLESTFMGIWYFGRDKVSRKVRLFSIWMVAIGTNLSSVWIITANAFMQNPVGYTLNNGRVELESISELITNPYAGYMFMHTIITAYVVGSFFVLAVSAWHIYRNQHVEFFKKSFKIAAVMALLATMITPVTGHLQGLYVGKVNPAKAASFEAVWETTDNLGFSLIQIPNQKEEKNFEALTIPKVGTFMYKNSFEGTVTGLKDIPKDERPNVTMVFWAFRIMVMLGTVLMAVGLFSAYLSYKDRFEKHRWFMKYMPFMLALPYIAINAGWIVTEVGRQPWTVYGLMRTEDSVSPLATGQILFSLITLVIFYLILGAIDIYLLVKTAKQGPEVDSIDTDLADGGIGHGA